MMFGFKPDLNGLKMDQGTSVLGPPEPGMSMPQPPTQPAKHSFFGEGGAGRNIAGYIGDALLQMSHMAPIYQPNMQYKQRVAQQQDMMQQKQSADWQNWVAQQMWKQANPDTKPTAMQQNYDWLAQNHPDYASQYLKRQTDPIQWITGPDGIPRPFSTTQSGPVPAPAGVTFTPLPEQGGPSQPATGGF